MFDGKPLTSCVVEHVEGGVAKQKRLKLGGNEDILYEAILELCPVDDGPVSAAAATADAKKKMVVADGRDDRRSQALQRAFESPRALVGRVQERQGGRLEHA
ncbi:MAG: hypothetical protein IH986_18420, partial [Planctomycetes bacterium]|nr:hypothetical protein [Planctomycetota bacterium]